MSKNKSLTKGNVLEDAVEQIQRLIIKTNPSLKSSKFTIERKKIIFPGEVRKEIDLYVKVDPGNDLESIFLFECKNWEDAVDPNSIIAFNSKVEEMNATKGFFIAKKYSKYAKLEAKKHPRISILVADDSPINVTPFPECHMAYHDRSKRKINAKIFPIGHNENKGELEKIDPEKVIYEKSIIPYKDFFMKLCESTINEKMRSEKTHLFNEGTYSYSHKKDFEFSKGKLQIEDFDIEKVAIDVAFEIQIIKPVIVSQFDIERKGLYLREEYITPCGNKFNATFVAIK